MQNEINQDDFYDFCKRNGASEEFISWLHYWLDQYESKK